MAEEDKAEEDQLSWGRRLKRIILHPATRREKIICAVFWVVVAVALGAVSFFAVPKFFTKVVKPFLDLCKERLSKPAIAAICFAALSLLPVVLINPNLFIWLAAATLGSGLALLLSLVANTVGMALPFLLCKWLVEDRVHRWAVKRDWVHALYLAAEEVGTFKVMVLMRLGPFPHGLLNYIAATSRDIAFWPYITGSFVGAIPDVVIQVFVGTSVDGLADIFSGASKPTPGRIVSIVLPIIFGIILAVVAWVFTKRALARIRAQAEAHHPEHAHSLEAEAMELGRLERGAASSLDGATTASRNSHKDSRRTRSLDGHPFVTRMTTTKSDLAGSNTLLLENSNNSSPERTQAPAAPGSM